MIYLIEGPDGSGKTTLAQSIACQAIDKKEALLYLHEKQRTGVTNIPNIDYRTLIKDILEWKEKDYNVILDRGFISTIVYRSIYEPESPTVSDTSLIDDLFRVIDKVIFCLPGKDKEQYMEHFKKMVSIRQEDYPDIELAGKVWEKFSKLYQTFKPSKVELYDILGKDLKENR